MTPTELHLLLKERPDNNLGYRAKKTFFIDLVNQLNRGILSIRDELKHFNITSIKEKRPDIYDRMSKEAVFYDREDDFILDFELGKYTR